MNRRGFLGALAAAIAGATLDPERLLWQPGRKLISIPKPVTVTTGWAPVGQGFLQIGDIFTIAGRFEINPRTRKEMIGLQRYIVTSVEWSPSDTTIHFEHAAPCRRRYQPDALLK